jgi:hypothetical protein
MSHPGDIVRRKVAMWLGGAAGLAVIVGALSLAPANQAGSISAGANAAPDLGGHRNDVALVMVTTSEEKYHLSRENGVWVMPEKGRYTVRPEMIAQLTDAMAAMRFGTAMTRDERKLDRIGLGDPASGGAGALVEIGDGKGETFAKLIVGRRDGKTYVRKPADDQAWATTEADPPPLHRAARWLDLDVVKIAAADIAEVEVRPAGGQAYRLRPVDGTATRFALAPPFDGLKLVAGFAPNPPGLALTRLSPEDVGPLAVLAGGQPVAQHITQLKSGLAIRVMVLKTAKGRWARIEAGVAPGASSGATAEAEAINTRAAPWAFGLSEADASNLTTPLSAIADVK